MGKVRCPVGRTLAANAGIQDIAIAYNLPNEKYGHIDRYSNKEASLHVNIYPLEDFKKC
jgi:hypothetical protein